VILAVFFEPRSLDRFITQIGPAEKFFPPLQDQKGHFSPFPSRF